MSFYVGASLHPILALIATSRHDPGTLSSLVALQHHLTPARLDSLSGLSYVDRMPTIQASKFEFAVDECDYARLNGHRWWAVDMGGYVYAFTKIDGKPVGMHRLILGAPQGKVVDHISGDTLDNRRSNLRMCLQSENMMNRKTHANNALGVKGVHLHRGRYRAQIRAHGKKHNLGIFTTLGEAKNAYDRAAIRLHAEFARLS